VVVEGPGLNHYTGRIVRQTIARLIDGLVLNLAVLGLSNDHEAAGVVDKSQGSIGSIVDALLHRKVLQMSRPSACRKGGVENELPVEPLAAQLGCERSAIGLHNLK